MITQSNLDTHKFLALTALSNLDTQKFLASTAEVETRSLPAAAEFDCCC